MSARWVKCAAGCGGEARGGYEYQGRPSTVCPECRAAGDRLIGSTSAHIEDAPGCNEACDLCADVGIDRPAVAEAVLGGRIWAFVCEPHRVRMESSGGTVVDLPTFEGEVMMPWAPEAGEVPC